MKIIHKLDTPSSPRRMKRVWTPKVIFLLVLLISINCIQVGSLVRKAVYKATDFTVFYNTGVLLGQGAGAQMYEGRDESTGWLRTIPPFGQMVFQPFVKGDIRLAAILWGGINLLLLGASAATLFYVARRLDSKCRIFLANVPILILILLALAPGSIQVGQFSVLFTAFWIFFLGISASRFRRWASVALAVPAGIKIYPLLLSGVFLFQRRYVAFGLSLVFAASTLAVPFLVYGSRTPSLTVAFWQNAIVGPNSRVNESQEVDSTSNQGMDAILLRYLTHNPRLELKNPTFPHLSWAKSSISRLTNVLRLIIISIAVWVGFSVWKRLENSPLWGTILLMSLMCATLYLILPGAKSRYAIYTFLSFVPLVLQCFAAKRLNRKSAYKVWCAVIVVGLLLTITFMPSSLRLYGVGLLGPLILWVINIEFLLRLTAKKPRVSLV